MNQDPRNRVLCSKGQGPSTIVERGEREQGAGKVTELWNNETMLGYIVKNKPPQMIAAEVRADILCEAAPDRITISAAMMARRGWLGQGRAQVIPLDIPSSLIFWVVPLSMSRI